MKIYSGVLLIACAALIGSVSLATADDSAAEGPRKRTPAELREEVTGSYWKWSKYDLFVVFGKETYYLTDWGERTGSWEAVSGKRLLCKAYDGSKLSVEFNADLTRFVARSEDGRVRTGVRMAKMPPVSPR